MKLLSILLIALGASYANAGHHSEALWQAHGGQNVIHTDYNYESVTWDYDDDAVSGELTTMNTNRISLDYERGLNDMFSLGLGLDYISMSAGDGSGFDSTGINHINVFFRGNMGIGFGHLHYGLDGRLALSDREEDTDGRLNGSQGRHEIEPFIGLMMGDRASMTYGARIAYQFNTTQTNIDESEPESSSLHEIEFDGGNIIKAQLFFEKALTDKSIFGVSLDYWMKEYQSLDDADLFATELDIGQEFNIFKLSAYGAVGCGCGSMNLTFLPKFTLKMGSGETSAISIPGGNTYNDIKTGTAYAMEFALRKEF